MASKCRWHCGRTTKNVSRVCSFCWAEAEKQRQPSDEGYKAWVEKRHAKAAARVTKPRKSMSDAQREALSTARRAKLLKQTTVVE
jgi:hypothetical protein